MDVFTHFNNKLTEALVKCTKKSLEMLKNRIGTSSINLRDITQSHHEVPLLRTQFVLQIPTIIISPSIEKLQSSFNEMVNNLLMIHAGIKQWGQRPSHGRSRRDTFGAEVQEGEDVAEPKNYYQVITDHKDIVRNTIAFQGIISMLKNDILLIANDYVEAYSYIWTPDRNNQTKTFVESEPTIEQIKDAFLKYDALREEIRNLPPYHIVGCIQIDMENMKGALRVEIGSWKNAFNSMLKEAYKQKINQFMNFMKDKSEILERKINDLEDVRIAMKCLNEIRENFIYLDITLVNIEDTYAIMANFNVPIAKEDQDVVDGLRYSFNNMQQMAKTVQNTICQMQKPLKQQLMDGVLVMKANVERFDHNFEMHGPMVDGIPAKEASERLILAQARFDELWEQYETYSSGESLFGIEITQYPVLDHRKKELNLLQKLYSLYVQVMRSIDGYYDIQWRGIDLESIANELIEFQNKCRKLPKAMYEWPAYIDLKEKIDDFNEICPLLVLMANKAMKDHHWDRLSKLCNHFFDVESENFTLAHVIEAPLLKYKEDIEDICISAVKEKDIESKLKQVIADWANVDLNFAHFKQRGELLLKGVETAQIISQLEDSLMIIGSLLANRYSTLYKKEIQSWQNKLGNTAEILAKWLLVQNLWAYLEAVFIGGDIAKQLPAEAKRFSIIDKSWVKLMHRARDKLNAVDTCTSDETMSQLLPHLVEQLESCQKSLSGYLETKRMSFPRFYFVSDPNLLEILGQAADCHSIQHYLDEFFDNVAKVDFSDVENDKIVAIYSHENEKVVLDKEVACIGGVEIWLNTLLKMHQQSVGSVISQGLQLLSIPENDICTLIDSAILQTGLLAIQTLWTRDSEVAIVSAKRDRTIMKKTDQWFLDLLNGLIEVTVMDLTKYARAKYEALITIHVHQRDIFNELCKLKIRSIEDFEWLKQARFYYEEETEAVVIKITNIDFTYQNEFLGCTDRLAVTPLTDRCYITLAQAIGMNFGGAPAGPAGTGKTETTKDMGKCLGKYVVVFNCSDQMDFRGLGRIFKGLAQAGAWGCFDEFNRIDLPVLSVAAQQIAIVLTARKEKRTSFIFSDGQTYPIDMEFGLFITMNPGYAGRQELPENLKIQFRSIAMMVPDRQIIMRVKLAACGFKENVLLARKFFTLYKLCEEQLSKQVHYDFGLRNILSCLRTLGAQKRAHPEESEETTLMRVLRYDIR
ncbi:dynein heavy chain 8, axonemal-like [Fopius arisanus]|uniref:Dynein heavy chain 8, axonemal-like n=1 Tax=Fopius arisanus TaxID=64838 RepID=A0A9R1THA7_9HYME|nr:PREDICTED: dynein heavy chain 8, axonemal-like [Fopius arisanus]